MHKEFEFLKSFFTNNGYPSSIVYSVIKSFLNNKIVQSESTSLNLNTDEKTKLYFVFPYFGQQSEKMSNELSAIFNKYFPDFDIKLVLINRYTIGNFFKYKDNIPKGVRSSLIYEFCCARCASRYVGSTCRNLYMRVAEHCGRSFRTGAILTSPPQSAVRSHAEQCDSTIDLANFKIIDQTQNFIDLRILESLHIFKSKPPPQ